MFGRRGQDASPIHPAGHGASVEGPPPDGVEWPDSGPTASERIAQWVMVLSVLVLVIGLLGYFVKVPYAIETPGSVTDTLGSHDGAATIEVDGAETYPTEGELYFTTVRVIGGPERHVTVWEYVKGRLDPNATVLPEEQIFGTQTSDDEVKRLNQAEMQGSQKNAIAVGIRSTGVEVEQENIVAQIAEGYPADGPLQLKDAVIAVDGQAVERVADIVTAISDRQPGDEVDLTIERSGTERDVSITTSDIGGGRAGIGVGLEPLYDYPFEVRIDAGNVGGPSAGMMFALAVNDVLTPGPLTGGQSIAGTGTIDDAGRVGAIGGIRQKLVGAKDGGAAFFLAPAPNCEEVVGNVPDGLQVVRVATMDDAVDAVEAIAEGDTEGLPTCG